MRGRKIFTNHFKLAWISILLLILVIGCIDQVEFETDQEDQTIVIDGVFSDLAEIQEIHISKSISLSSQVNEPVDGAELYVEDQDGNQITFVSINEGRYVAFARAERDKQYRLVGTLPGGVEITSPFQKVPDSVSVNEVTLVDTLVTFVDESGKFKRWRALDFYANISIDQLSEKKYLRFSPKTVFQQGEVMCGPFHVPKVCYFYNDNPPIEVNIFTIDASDDNIELNSLVYRRQIDYTLAEVFALDLHLYSYNQEQYEYWKDLKSIFDQDGGITDSTPGRLRGNISTNNGTDVQGQFAVIGKTRKIKIVRNGDFPTQQLPLCGIAGSRPVPLPTACCACDVMSNASTDKPDYWP